MANIKDKLIIISCSIIGSTNFLEKKFTSFHQLSVEGIPIDLEDIQAYFHWMYWKVFQKGRQTGRC